MFSVSWEAIIVSSMTKIKEFGKYEKVIIYIGWLTSGFIRVYQNF